MWRSRTAMPVSSVCRSTRSAPLTLPGSAALAVTSPLTLLVRASKLPPTVSGHTTTTSAPLTLYASAARDEPATPTTPTTPRTTALRTMDIGGSWLLNALDRELDGEGARACGRAGARAVERRRLREARRHADDRAVLPHVDARDDAAAVLPQGRRLFAAGAEHVRRELQPVRVPMRLQLRRIRGVACVAAVADERERIGQA